MLRRSFLLVPAAVAMGVAAEGFRRWSERVDPQIYRPGMEHGHWLRDRTGSSQIPAPTQTIETEVAILGSGVAGLSCAWQLARAGFRDFVWIQGPEIDGNCASGRLGDLNYPRGAHYLPLPSEDSVHVREMLQDVGLVESGGTVSAPLFDETALVHAPVERLLKDGHWHDELLPTHGIDGSLIEQHERFHEVTRRWGAAVGRDGRKAFVMPRMLSSNDPEFLALDKLTMADWLKAHRFDSPWLQWYCDYACRDDYGIGSDETSAWAGLHYFSSRMGRAANAEAGAVLTWPDGLATLVNKLRGRISGYLGPEKPQQLPGMAVKVREHSTHVETWVVNPSSGASVAIRSRRVVMAMPLFVAARILDGAESDFGLGAQALPRYAPWMVTNVLLKGFPRELEGAPLAWDNVVYQSKALGYVVSTHQLIRQARPAQTVFTTYRCLNDQPMEQARRWLAQASPEELWQVAAEDLHKAYPAGLMRRVQQAEITLRAHAMSSPRPGFLSQPHLDRVRAGSSRVHFAHADLSGISVFEEASYWGQRVARRFL